MNGLHPQLRLPVEAGRWTSGVNSRDPGTQWFEVHLHRSRRYFPATVLCSCEAFAQCVKGPDEPHRARGEEEEDKRLEDLLRLVHLWTAVAWRGVPIWKEVDGAFTFTPVPSRDPNDRHRDDFAVCLRVQRRRYRSEVCLMIQTEAEVPPDRVHPRSS